MELLVVITIVSFALIPLLFLGQQSTRGASSTGKHLLAAHLAAGLLERFLALPYEEARAMAAREFTVREFLPAQGTNLFYDPSLRQALAGKAATFLPDLKRTLGPFTFRLDIWENTDQDILKLTVKIEWPVESGGQATTLRHTYVLEGLKHREAP